LLAYAGGGFNWRLPLPNEGRPQTKSRNGRGRRGAGLAGRRHSELVGADLREHHAFWPEIADLGRAESASRILQRLGDDRDRPVKPWGWTGVQNTVGHAGTASARSAAARAGTRPAA
jgi:hypothetical protein